jgi:7-cyano-7-deazaguanine synthase in queuosine biosynthesis
MIDIKDYPNDIALLFSGGIDSTLLFYLISTEINKHYPDKTLTLYIIDRYNNPCERANTVFEKIVNKTNLQVNLRQLSILPVFQQYEILVASKIVAARHSVVVCGFNKYPKDETIRPNYIVNVKDSEKVKFPLAHIEKDKIVQEFFNLGIDDILPITHSCGLNRSIPCGTCFNCRERKWAYNILQKSVDLGI